MAEEKAQNKNKQNANTVNKEQSQEASREQENHKAVEAALYDRLIERLNEEKSRLERDLKHEYRSARRYVRANPEEGVTIAFVGGLAAGLIISKVLSK